MKPAGEDTESHRAGKHSPSSFSSNLPAPFSRATRLKVRHRSSVFAHECSHQKQTDREKHQGFHLTRETCQILFVHVVDQNFDQILIVKQIIHSRHKYSVFYIDTEGGENTKTKTLFRNSALKQFKYLCIYAERGVTVEEALKRDGRFIDDLGNFTLSDNNEPNSITERTQKVDSLDQKRLKTVVEKNDRSDDIEEIYEILCRQFPRLKELMESRFPGDSYQQTLSLRNDDFGKIQQSFCEVHRIRKLLKLGESVCKVIIPNVCVGTGFVLFDNFILSNAHLFQPCHNGQSLMEGVEVFILFNYEDPEPHTNYDVFQLAHTNIFFCNDKLDYAILELNPEVKVPPGLLKHFGPMPLNGEACLIGHPEGGVKKMDPTCIIEKEKRKQAVNDHINLKTEDFIIHLIRSTIKAQGIENIMMADNVITYDTFMYHGSSGSPVFDAHGRVCGLHMGGYIYDKGSVIEFAQPVLSVFEHFVKKLREIRQDALLKKLKKEAKGNQYLKKVLSPRTTDTDECSDSEESMETE
uniref:Serine protease n=1 Tax=Mola mola TaxID=94237 RepID=A0A3Q3WCJ3_MOLML